MHLLNRVAAALALLIGTRPDDFAILRPRAAVGLTTKSVNEQDAAMIVYDSEPC